MLKHIIGHLFAFPLHVTQRQAHSKAEALLAERGHSKGLEDWFLLSQDLACFDRVETQIASLFLIQKDCSNEVCIDFLQFKQRCKGTDAVALACLFDVFQAFKESDWVRFRPTKLLARRQETIELMSATLWKNFHRILIGERPACFLQFGDRRTNSAAC